MFRNTPAPRRGENCRGFSCGSLWGSDVGREANRRPSQAAWIVRRACCTMKSGYRTGSSPRRRTCATSRRPGGRCRSSSRRRATPSRATPSPPRGDGCWGRRCRRQAFLRCWRICNVLWCFDLSTLVAALASAPRVVPFSTTPGGQRDRVTSTRPFSLAFDHCSTLDNAHGSA